MEDHYSDVEVFHNGNCLGKVWTLKSYDDDGDLRGIDYEIEIAVGAHNLQPVHIMHHEIPDMIKSLHEALDYVKKLGGNLASFTI